MSATQRPLYSYPPGTATSSNRTSPRARRAISDGGQDGHRSTIKPHIYFSPPVNREVNSGDVAYAIERGANPNVANPYFQLLLQGRCRRGKGQRRPDPRHRNAERRNDRLPSHQAHRGAARRARSACRCRLRCRRNSPSRSTPTTRRRTAPNTSSRPGPYMLKSDSAGQVPRHRLPAGQSATLVRNPHWNPHTDFRPAYLDQIDINIGGEPTVIGKQVLAGEDVVQNDTARAVDRQGSVRTLPPADHLHARLGHLLRLARTTRTGRSPTSMRARPCGRRSTATRSSRSAAERSRARR